MINFLSPSSPFPRNKSYLFLVVFLKQRPVDEIHIFRQTSLSNQERITTYLFGRWNYFYYTNMMHMLKMVMMISNNREWAENSNCFWTITQQGSLKRGRDSTKEVFETFRKTRSCVLLRNINTSDAPNWEVKIIFTCGRGSYRRYRG